MSVHPNISHKKLRGVAYDIGHHALSGLSYLFPHLLNHAVKHHTESISIDLLSPDFGLSESTPPTLSTALNSLKEKFIHILSSKNLVLDNITQVHLTFNTPDTFQFNQVAVSIRTSDDKTVTKSAHC